MNTYIKIRVSVQSNVIFVFNVILKNEPSRLDGLFASASRPSGSGRRAGPGRENNYISEHARDCCLDQGELSSPVEATVSCVFTPTLPYQGVCVHHCSNNSPSSRAGSPTVTEGLFKRSKHIWITDRMARLLHETFEMLQYNIEKKKHWAGWPLPARPTARRFWKWSE